jgi:cytochrome c peroxidase
MPKPPKLASLAAAAATLAAAALMLCGFSRDDPKEPTAAAQWTPEELGVIVSLSLAKLPPTPKDPSNAVDTNADAAALGKRLFNDPRLSRSAQVSCASCHSQDKQF